MRINHNMSSINTYGRLQSNNSSAAKTLEKLSSGYRINRAGDDAAGLAISEKMRGQILGLNQASRNAQDSISMIQTAEGGAATIHSMLQRMRELSVQAANDTLIDEDRLKLQDEILQVSSQINSTAINTEYNTIKLINQTGDGTSPFSGISQAALDDLTNKLPGWINDALSAINAQLDIALPDSPVKRPMAITYYYDSAANAAAASMGTVDGSSLTLQVNVAKVFDSSGNLVSEGVMDTLIAHEVVHALQFTEMPFSIDGSNQADENWFLEGLAMTIQGGNLFTVTDHDVNLSDPFDGDYRSAFEAVKVLHEITNGGINAVIDRLELGDTLDQALANTTQNFTGTELAGAVGAADFNSVAAYIGWFNGAGNADVVNYIAASADFTAGTSGAITQGAIKGSNSNLTLDQTITNGTGMALTNMHYNITYTNGSNGAKSTIVFHIGANTNQSVNFQTRDLRTTALGISGISVETRAAASNSINYIDLAISKVSSARSYFGAMQNRLEHTITNLEVASENVTYAESRIRDADMAREMMDFTKNNILAQAAQTMLLQSNQQPQSILQLLR